MVPPGGIVVIDAMVVCVIDHLDSRRLVNAAFDAVDDRQAHGAES